MSARLPMLSILALSAAIACAPPAEAPMASGPTAADSAAIMAIRDAEITGIVSKDTVMSFLADDAHFLPEGSPSLHGVAAIRAWFAEFNSMFNFIESSCRSGRVVHLLSVDFCSPSNAKKI